MTKARDLANASTALSAVSATELGYLDGVTSAVQTQLNNKVDETGGSVIAVASGSTVPLTITNEGTGNSFVVQDSANPDSTPFVVASDGRVGIGMIPNTRELSVFQDTTPVIQLTNTASGTAATDGALFYLAGDQLSLRAAETTGSISFQTAGANGRMLIASTGETTVINTTTNTPAVRNIYMSTSDPSGGSDGDVWIKYT